MDRQVWKNFAGQRVLLLQGPIGPFFAGVAKALAGAGAAAVHKINFCGGDWLFYPNDSTNYRGTLPAWPAHLERFLDQHRIDAIVLFGDCRPVHAAAIRLATQRGLPYWVFEEGYIRPNYVTFERHGVNGYSGLPRDIDFYQALPASAAPPEREIGNTFDRTALLAMAYYIAGSFGKPWFRHRVHHRSLNMLEGLVWWRSYFRKIVYRISQRHLLPQLSGRWSKQFFLVALQTAGDSQVHTHSGFKSVADFITEVATSFAEHAPAATLLVIKHHPLDRGYHDYSRLLRRLGSQLGIAERIRYVHDLNLPTLLSHARGVIVINSTVGLSALHHQTPVITLGKAIYNMPGLTFQGGLRHFWTDAQTQIPDLDLYWKFRNHVVDQTQLNGSFYKRMDGGDAAGLIGRSSAPLPAQASPPRPAVAPVAARPAGRLTLHCFDHAGEVVAGVDPVASQRALP
ncbi:capsule biosynthesis protein [Piscinibacter sakaiensis]|uniref:capsule biosynthesis protein n=1 Tax=Piscinibacter sakaiensis TaxID=1547922 RepID=UPI003AAC6013